MAQSRWELEAAPVPPSNGPAPGSSGPSVEVTPALAPSVIPPRRERLLEILELVGKLPPVSSALEAYAQLSRVMNEYEDRWFGAEHWAPPRTFLDGRRTPRLYPILPESFHPIPGFPGVTLMLALRELLFISRFGAIEFQDKLEGDRFGRVVPFHTRTDRVIFSKADAAGDGPWHEKNQR